MVLKEGDVSFLFCQVLEDLCEHPFDCLWSPKLYCHMTQIEWTMSLMKKTLSFGPYIAMCVCSKIVLHIWKGRHDKIWPPWNFRDKIVEISPNHEGTCSSYKHSTSVVLKYLSTEMHFLIICQHLPEMMPLLEVKSSSKNILLHCVTQIKSS